MKLRTVIAAASLASSVALITPVVAEAAAMSSTTTFKIDATGKGVSGGMGIKTSAAATGTIAVNTAKGTVCYEIYTKGLSKIAAAHIHKGAKGVDGPVAVSLNPAKFNSMTMTAACVKVPVALAKAIVAHPANFYFNVHTPSFPNGAVRTQL